MRESVHSQAVYRFASLLACVPLCACTVTNPYEGGTFGDLSASTESSGDGDGDPASGDGDGDPTSGDGDGDPTSGDGDGDPMTGDGDGEPTSGDGDGDPPASCERFRYTYRFDNDSWSSAPLDQLWVGPNAPPCSVYARSSDCSPTCVQCVCPRNSRTPAR